MPFREHRGRNTLEHRSPEQIIRAYLDQVTDKLSDLPESERHEIIVDLRAHIEVRLGGFEGSTETDVHAVLDQLGHPDKVAREAREKRATTAAAAAPSRRSEQRSTPSALEVAAIILTALIWPVGLLLAWISSRWITRDKVIATIIPAVTTAIFGLVALGGLLVYDSFTIADSATVVVDEQTGGSTGGSDPEPRSPADFGQDVAGENAGATLLVIFAFLLLSAGPFIAAIFLAVRLQPSSNVDGRQHQVYRTDVPPNPSGR
jgi:uncharacterized membrane protein